MGWGWTAAAILLPLPKGFHLPIVHQIEGELGHAVFKLVLKKAAFSQFLTLSCPFGWWCVVKRRKKKEGEILLKDKEKCIVPSAGARQ